MARFYAPLMWWLMRPGRNALPIEALYDPDMNYQFTSSKQVQNAKTQMYFNHIQRDLEPLIVGERFGLAKTMLNFYLSRKASSGYRQFTSSLLMEVRGNSWKKHQAIVENTEKTRLRDKPRNKIYAMEDKYMQQIKAESEGRGKVLPLAKYSEALVRQALSFQHQVKDEFASDDVVKDTKRIAEKYDKKVSEIFAEARKDGYSNIQVCEHLWRRMEKMQKQNPDLGHLFTMQTGARLVEMDNKIYVLKKDDKGEDRLYYPGQDDVKLYIPSQPDVLRHQCERYLQENTQIALNLQNPDRMQNCLDHFDKLKKALDDNDTSCSFYQIWSVENSSENDMKTARYNEGHVLPFADMRMFGKRPDIEYLDAKFVEQGRILAKEIVVQRCTEEAAIQREEINPEKLNAYVESYIKHSKSWDDLMKMVKDSENDPMKIWKQANRTRQAVPFPEMESQAEATRDIEYGG